VAEFCNKQLNVDHPSSVNGRIADPYHHIRGMGNFVQPQIHRFLLVKSDKAEQLSNGRKSQNKIAWLGLNG
jgi:hypothetical protein